MVCLRAKITNIFVSLISSERLCPCGMQNHSFSSPCSGLVTARTQRYGALGCPKRSVAHCERIAVGPLTEDRLADVCFCARLFVPLTASRLLAPFRRCTYYLYRRNGPVRRGRPCSLHMKKIIASPAAPKAVGPYSQAVEVGGTLYVSGQLTVDGATGTMPVFFSCALSRTHTSSPLSSAYTSKNGDRLTVTSFADGFAPALRPSK